MTQFKGRFYFCADAISDNSYTDYNNNTTT